MTEIAYSRKRVCSKGPSPSVVMIGLPKSVSVKVMRMPLVPPMPSSFFWNTRSAITVKVCVRIAKYTPFTRLRNITTPRPSANRPGISSASRNDTKPFWKKAR